MRQGYAAFSRRDEQGMLATVHPEVEYHTIGLFPGLEPVYHGHEGLRRLLRAMDEAFDVIELFAERVVETEKGAVVLTRWHARGRDSGAEVTLAWIDEMELKDDLLYKRFSYEATPENLERYGLRDPTDVLRLAYEAWNAGDVEALLATIHPDVEWHTLGSFPGVDAVYRGHEGLVQLRRFMFDAFERMDMTAERISEDGNVLHVLATWNGKGRGSGADVRFATIEHLERTDDMLVLRRTAEEPTPEALERYGLAG